TYASQSRRSDGGAAREPSGYGAGGAAGLAQAGVPPSTNNTGCCAANAEETSRSSTVQSNWPGYGSRSAQRVPLSHSRTAPTENAGMIPVELLIVTPNSVDATACGGRDQAGPLICCAVFVATARAAVDGPCEVFAIASNAMRIATSSISVRCLFIATCAAG